MKYFIVIGLFLLSLNTYSQAIEEEEVPEVVVSTFKKKNARVKEYTWAKADKNFQVKFVLNNSKMMNEYSPKGELVLNRKEVDERNLLPPIERHLFDNYDHLRRQSAYLITKGKEKYYSITLYDRSDKKKTTEVQYTTSGQFITAWEPEIVIEEEVEEVDKFAQKVDRGNTEIDKGEVSGQKIPLKELPTEAQTYLQENYNRDWTARKCEIVETEKGLQYYVIMKLKGNRDEFEHYFDIHGKLISQEKIR